MYRVLRFFRDLQDNNHAYHVGEIFPHGGMAVSKDRLKELSTDANRRHVPLIEKVDDEVVEAESVAEDATQEPVEGFMNPPEPESVESPKPKKRRGRPRNDAK